LEQVFFNIEKLNKVHNRNLIFFNVINDGNLMLSLIYYFIFCRVKDFSKSIIRSRSFSRGTKYYLYVYRKIQYT